MVQLLKFSFVILLALGCGSSSHPLPQGALSGLVPQPQSVTTGGEDVGGRGFRCDGSLTVSWPEGWGMKAVRDWLDGSGLDVLQTAQGDAPGRIAWIRSNRPLGLEGYVLRIESDRVVIEAEDEEGAFRGWTTLRQILPPRCEQGCPRGFELPAVQIEDHAYLAHRGLLLDCCRHFMQPAFVKRIIDAIALQKMNVLHWHLTEDQGWRLPIQAYPKLTEVGGFRTEADGTEHGGFYTREEVRDIVEYAAERHIQVIPEIELPGHCRAALAAYPWLGCSGEEMDVPNNWGVFKDVYCAGSDTTMRFLKAVMDEVCDLFPSEVIHIGGDEVPKVRWASCESCQRRMAEEGIANEAELQTWFVNEIGNHLASKGRRIMGWDEILEGGLPKGAMVQSWRGMEGAIEATHQGTDAVVSPTSHCYLDYPLRSTDLKEVHGFIPVPDAAKGHRGSIVGGECNMWTERAPQDEVMGKVFPRATGLAEVLWSGPQITQLEGAYDGFLDRLDALSRRWAEMGLQPGLEGVPVRVEVLPSTLGKVRVVVHPNLRNVGGMVSFEPSTNEAAQPLGKVGDTLVVAGRGTLVVDVVIRGRRTAVAERFPLAGHAGAHQTLDLAFEPSSAYTGGGMQALADGRLGSSDFRDGAWQAVQGEDLTCTLDLGESLPIERLSTHLYLYQDAWIFMPSKVEWSVSIDGQTFEPLATQAPWGDALLPNPNQTVIPVNLSAKGVRVRHVRMRLVNPGPCPEWHAAATEPTWLFADELVVEVAH